MMYERIYVVTPDKKVQTYVNKDYTVDLNSGILQIINHDRQEVHCTFSPTGWLSVRHDYEGQEDV